MEGACLVPSILARGDKPVARAVHGRTYCPGGLWLQHYGRREADFGGQQLVFAESLDALTSCLGST